MKIKSLLVLFADSYSINNNYHLLLNVKIRNDQHKFDFYGTGITTDAAINDKIKEMFRSKLIESIGYPPFDKRRVDKWFNNSENRSIVLENVW